MTSSTRWVRLRRIRPALVNLHARSPVAGGPGSLLPAPRGADADEPDRPAAMTVMPIAAAIRATRLPIAPTPTMPKVLPASSMIGATVKQKSGQRVH